MPTIEKQLELEGRLVTILMTALLISWLAGLLVVNHIFVLQDERDAARARAAAALWVAEDQRLAVRACYSGRIGTWEKGMIHLTADD